MKAEPPSFSSSPLKSINIKVDLRRAATGATTLRISPTSPAAEIITVPGAITFCSPYFWVMERESLPVGMLMPSARANLEQLSTARYRAASSPAFLQGHIQLADRETDFSPSLSCAPEMLVSASAMESTEPLAGSMRAACGAWPMEVAIPDLPR